MTRRAPVTAPVRDWVRPVSRRAPVAAPVRNWVRPVSLGGIWRTQFVLLGAALLAVPLFGGAAGAQVPPPPPQTEPVFEIVAPTVSPVCGNAVLVVVLAPGLVAGPTGGVLPLEAVTPALGPAFVVCGSVPAPPARLSCDADRSINETLSAVAAAVAGTPLPVGVDVVGPLVEQAIVIEDKLPSPANSTGLLDQVAFTLNCKPAPRAATPPPAPDAEDEPGEESFVDDEFSLAPFFDDALAPDIFGRTPTSVLDDEALPLSPAAEVGSVGFLYPVVFGLPLIMLLIGGYLGRALTQPVGPPQR